MICTAPHWRWLRELRRIHIEGSWSDKTGDVETLLVLLSGTFDILAGGGSWRARGVRTSPLAGKPVALFLPPNTRVSLDNGTGHCLLVSSLQPARESVPEEAASISPLLSLAGSGKAYDPATGEWRRKEDFPSAPEAILPRRIEEFEEQGALVRRVFPFAYKALSLSLEEVMLPAGTTYTLPTLPDGAHYPADIGLYYDAPGGLAVDETPLHGEGFFDRVVPHASFSAGKEDAYLCLVFAGDK